MVQLLTVIKKGDESAAGEHNTSSTPLESALFDDYWHNGDATATFESENVEPRRHFTGER